MVGAVSYTHLDVYKRQPELRVEFGQAVQRGFSVFQRGKSIIRDILINEELCDSLLKELMAYFTLYMVARPWEMCIRDRAGGYYRRPLNFTLSSLEDAKACLLYTS